MGDYVLNLVRTQLVHKLCAYSLIVVGLATIALAENETVPSASEDFTINTNQALRAYPGGDQVGSLLAGSKFTKGEVRGDWTKIIFDAWIPNDEIVSRRSEAGAPVVPTVALVLKDFDVAHVSKRDSGSSKDRVKLTLRLQNTISQPIASWEGWISVYHRSGSELFRAPVSSSKKTVAPNEIGEFSFFWQDGDDQYSYLVGKNKADLSVKIVSMRVSN